MTAEVSLKISRKSNGKYSHQKLCKTIKNPFYYEQFPFLSNGKVITLKAVLPIFFKKKKNKIKH